MGIAVLGSGTMGRGIAVRCARHGHEVVLYNRQRHAGTERQLEREMRIAQKLSPVTGTPAPIALTDDLGAIAGCSLVIESIAEDLDAKCALLRQVSTRVHGEALVATNTSSLPLDRLAGSVEHGARFVAMHFFNPAWQIDTVEVAPAPGTSASTLEAAHDFVRSVGGQAVRAPGQAGYIVNRALFLLIAESLRLESQGISPVDIDSSLKATVGMRMGPLELADFIGLDVCDSILRSLRDATGSAAYEVGDALSRRVGRGTLGRKSGAGIHSYGGRS